MAIPDLIPIMHEPGYRTDTIGSYSAGQFFASVTGGFARGVVLNDDWSHEKRWYAVLHRFDRQGHYASSDIWFAGTTADGEGTVIPAAEAVLQEWLSQLPEVVFCDIAVRLFQLEMDGIVFGLVDETDDEFGERVELYPDDLGFAEPWDGEYST